MEQHRINIRAAWSARAVWMAKGKGDIGEQNNARRSAALGAGNRSITAQCHRATHTSLSCLHQCNNILSILWLMLGTWRGRGDGRHLIPASATQDLGWWRGEMGIGNPQNGLWRGHAPSSQEGGVWWEAGAPHGMGESALSLLQLLFLQRCRLWMSWCRDTCPGRCAGIGREAHPASPHPWPSINQGQTALFSK